jgi:hypothetical protein
MRMLIMIPLLFAAATATASDKPGTRDKIAVEKALAGKTAGKPQDCLSPRDAQSSSVHNGTVLFRVSRKLVWKNDMRECRLLREDDILVTNLYGTARICRGDISQIVDRAGLFGKGSCVFGDFVPYRVPEAGKAQ